MVSKTRFLSIYLHPKSRGRHEVILILNIYFIYENVKVSSDTEAENDPIIPTFDTLVERDSQYSKQ